MRDVTELGAWSGRPESAERDPVTPLWRGRAEPLHNLPLQLTRFVGREQELAEIRQLVATERLVTLTGTGGIGKTRLAIEAAALLPTAYRDGVWLDISDTTGTPAATGPRADRG